MKKCKRAKFYSYKKNQIFITSTLKSNPQVAIFPRSPPIPPIALTVKKYKKKSETKIFYFKELLKAEASNGPISDIILQLCINYCEIR